MRFMAEYNVRSDPDAGWLDPDNVATFARTLEEVGFGALAFTDHPAPSAKWLAAGGHETFDPFAALTYCAAVTRRIRLMTHLAVVPYRNPLLQARSMTTVDVLSGGRAIFALGTGYLRSEFAALGVDAHERNELFDEAVEVIRKAWTQDVVEHTGRHFHATGQAMLPRPVQRPHPPLWLGGNSGLALDRVARFGQGWAALVGSPQLARSARTTSITSTAQLADRIRELERRLHARGRTLAEIDVLAPTPAGVLANGWSPAQRLDELARLREAGVTWAGVVLPGGGFAAAMDSVRRFGAEVVPALTPSDDHRRTTCC
ncbi:hypothetical protein; putative IMP dehydrogenase / GMP reductase domains [Frankia alni ACN14a]|uniref:Luciferase-like domain-containing protein n=3 Tax=Frankiaceae TaxID=74712 RepID=Q0RL38_FRAAA|nr:hypothetical protein; putative IMP dehydrogenase / GMP reductase domains [Frankia alni ACN14a]